MNPAGGTSLRLLVVTPLLPAIDATTGGETVKYRMLHRLAEQHEITLATFVATAACGEALDALRVAGIDVHALPRPRPAGLQGLLRRGALAARWALGDDPLRSLSFHDPAMQRLIDALTTRRSYDVIQVEDNAMASYRYPEKTPSLLTDHDVHDPELRVRSRERARWRAYQARIWRRFDRIQVFTERDASVIARIAPDASGRVRVNPFGVDVPAEPDPSRERPGRVVFVGNFLHAPNVDAAIWLAREIWPLVRARRPDSTLALVGADPPARVRALAGAGVEVTGRVPHVEPWLEEAAVLLAPIRSGGGMRVKVLHAMALGRAVVTTPLGAEGVGAGAPLRVSATADALAEETVRLLEDGDARRELGRRARAFVSEHHGWDAFHDRLARIHDELRGARDA